MAGGGGGDEGEFGLQIAPMLDVMFVLLLFFMVAAGANDKEEVMGVKVPGSGAPKNGGTVDVPLNIAVRDDGTVLLNDAVYGEPTDVELPKLRAKLKEVTEKFAEQPVIIKPDNNARHERIIQVMDALSYAQVKNLAFRYQSK